MTFNPSHGAPLMTLPAVPFYAIASGLVGFPFARLRVRVSEVRSGYAWVRTADLLDAGTPLTLDVGQIVPLDEPGPGAWAKRDEQERDRLARDLVIDRDGVARWTTNGRAIPADVAATYGATGRISALTVRNTARARYRETAEFLAAYRAADRGPSAEERAEARAAHGAGVRLVNVLTGRAWMT